MMIIIIIIKRRNLIRKNVEYDYHKRNKVH